MSEEIKLIPIDSIRIINPRHRDPKKFEIIVQSIKNLGLKKPIKVSKRTAQEGSTGYDLVAGQGRIEAFRKLNYKEIPAIVVNVSKENRLLMSLVENLARRFSTPMDLMREISRLKEKGDTNTVIAQKLDVSDSTVCELLKLMTLGEERLIDAVIRNEIPMTVAIDIAKTEDVETQRELLKGYEDGKLSHTAIRSIKRLMERRRFLGKKHFRGEGSKTTSAEGLVNAYRRETERQKALIRRAKVAETKLLFIVTAFKKLFKDENFINLLRAEGLANNVPKCMAKQLNREQSV